MNDIGVSYAGKTNRNTLRRTAGWSKRIGKGERVELPEQNLCIGHVCGNCRQYTGKKCFLTPNRPQVRADYGCSDWGKI